MKMTPRLEREWRGEGMHGKEKRFLSWSGEDLKQFSPTRHIATMTCWSNESQDIHRGDLDIWFKTHFSSRLASSVLSLI